MWKSVLLLIGAACLVGDPAQAQERELTQGHPVHLEDAFFTAAGEGTVLATGGLILGREDAQSGLFALDAQYGPLPRLQLGLGTLLSTNPRSTRDPASGDLNVTARMSLNGQSDTLPFLAVQLGTTLPTGDGSRAYDFELKGFATKAITVGLLPMFLHLNASVQGRAIGRTSDERIVRYQLAAGPSFTIPQHAPATIVADVFVDESVQDHTRETVGMEIGVRYRVSSIAAVHAGVGTAVSGPSGRDAFFVRVGLSVGFSAPAIGSAP